MTEAGNQEIEKRHLERHEIVQPVEICDRLSQCSVGRLVNIHAEGLMVMGKHVFKEDEIYRLDLHLPEAVNGRTAIPLRVDCLWSREAEDQVCWAGFRILDVTSEGAQDIETMIGLFGLHSDRAASGGL